MDGSWHSMAVIANEFSNLGDRPVSHQPMSNRLSGNRSKFSGLYIRGKSFMFMDVQSVLSLLCGSRPANRIQG